MRHRSGKGFPLSCPRVATPGRFRLNKSKTKGLIRITTESALQSSVSFRLEQPRRFPQQSDRLLAFFADRISNSNITASLAKEAMPEPLSFISTQGRLLCPQRHKVPQGRFTPAPYTIPSAKAPSRGRSTHAGLHGKGVNARMPLRIAPKP